MYVLVPGPGAYYYRIINVYKVVCSSILIVCKIIFSWIMEEELWIEAEAEKI